MFSSPLPIILLSFFESLQFCPITSRGPQPSINLVIYPFSLGQVVPLFAEELLQQFDLGDKGARQLVRSPNSERETEN